MSPESPLVPNAKLKQLYELMLKARMIGKNAKAALRKNGFTVERGHEGSRVGVTIDLQAGDCVVPLAGDFVPHLTAGALVRDVVSGNAGAAGDGIVLSGAFPSADDQFSFACGLAAAIKREGKQGVVIAFGQHPTRHAMIYAAREALPVIFVVESGSRTDMAHHAESNKVAGFVVDGNDVVGVYRVAQECIERARRGVGPSFIECKSPRWPGRVRFEKAMHRPIHELDDALAYMKHYLAKRGLWSAEWELAMKREIENEIKRASSATKVKPKRR